MYIRIRFSHIILSQNRVPQLKIMHITIQSSKRETAPMPPLLVHP